MTASGGKVGGFCVPVRACVFTCILFTLYSTEWHAGATLGRVGLIAAPLSLPGQMAPVTERRGGAMEGKGKEGALSCS